MRLLTVTLCALGLLSVSDLLQPGAATPIQGRTQGAALRSTGSLRPSPALTIAQSSQYYQDYQSVPATTAQTTSSIPLPEPPVVPQPQAAPQNPAPPKTQIAPQRPVTPTTPATPQTPATPGSSWLIQTKTPPTPPRSLSPSPSKSPGSATSKPSSDVVLTATDVQILGVAPELQQIVRSTIRTQPGGNVSNRQLQSDVAAILETGLFSNASFTTRTTPNGLSVTFQVQPILVRSLRLVNAQALQPEVANNFFATQIGTTVSPNAINQSIRQINEWYRQNGFNLARVIAVTPSREGILTLEVAEGTIGEIQIRFLNEDGAATDDKGRPIRGRTRERFIRQQIQTKPGQIFQDNVARQDLQRLFQTGLFNNGRVTLEGDAKRTIVVYNLTEVRSRGLNVSGGYNDDLGLFGNLGYSDRNVGGVGQQLGTNVLIGTRDVQFDGRFVSPYRETEPNKLGYSVNGFRRRGGSRVFDDDIRLANGDRVREGRFGGGVAVNRPIGDRWNGSLGLNYTRVSLRDANGEVVRRDVRGNPLSFSGTGIDDLTTINFTATRDSRNNPTSPSQGSFLTLSTDQFVPIGRGSIFGNRLQANYAEYTTVNLFNLEKTQKQPEVFAYNLQAGTTLGDLPPYEAFTLGGPNSIRGYDGGVVGVGRSFFLASAEYRFPIYRILGGAVFADFGSDLGTAKAVLGQPGVERGRPGAGFGVGVGLRLSSPFGVIRAGYGINDQGEGRFQVGFGEKF